MIETQRVFISMTVVISAYELNKLFPRKWKLKLVDSNISEIQEIKPKIINICYVNRVDNISAARYSDGL